MPTTTIIRKLHNRPYANCRVYERKVTGKDTDKFILTDENGVISVNAFLDANTIQAV